MLNVNQWPGTHEHIRTSMTLTYLENGKTISLGHHSTKTIAKISKKRLTHQV